jgi:hypothetical protein
MKLRLADESAAEVVMALGSDGQAPFLSDLARSPIAREALGWPSGHDAVHLAIYDGTLFVQWMGRGRNGYFRPIGPVMEIEEATHVSDGQ